jgi:hypothetical protein
MNHFTDIWRGEIKYGNFDRSLWLAVPNVSHPLFKALMDEIKAIEHFNNNGFNLYVFGGILENWTSWDIDVAITGPYRPTILKDLFYKILHISFQFGIYIDLKYILGSDVFDFQEWLKDSELKMIEYQVVEYSNLFLKNGIPQDFVDIKMKDGLWHRSIYLPSKKQLSKYEEGYIYNSPILII